MAANTSQAGMLRMGAGRQRSEPLPSPLVVELNWGLGDILLTTPALRAFKKINPDHPVHFRTRIDRRLSPYRTGATGSDMLAHNPDVTIVNSSTIRPPSTLEFRYAWFGGPSLDYPIQDHYFHQLGLDPDEHSRDSHYYITEAEAVWARETIGTGPTLAIAPHNGWPGKLWNRDAWWELMTAADQRGIRPIVLGGDPLPAFNHPAALNLAGRSHIRQAAAIVAAATYAVMVEGGLSNLRFACKYAVAPDGTINPIVGPGWSIHYRRAIILTCATRVGVQIWTPPDLTTEIRMMLDDSNHVIPGVTLAYDPDTQPGEFEMLHGRTACEPCMWRGEHVKARRGGIPPAAINKCPAGRSLRDVPAQVVIDALDQQIEQMEGVQTNG